MQHPDAATLLTLEREARHQGTHLTTADLQGCWMLQGVWSKGSLRPANLSNWSLRGLQARLVLRQLNSEQLAITNAVNLGPFQCDLRGPAPCKGHAPYFNSASTRLCFSPGADAGSNAPCRSRHHRDCRSLP